MWKVTTLGNVATVVAGQSPKGEHYNKEGEGLPFYQGKKDYGDRYLYSPTIWSSVVTKRVIEGDILMSVRAPVGALNIAREEICIGRGLASSKMLGKNWARTLLGGARENNYANSTFTNSELGFGQSAFLDEPSLSCVRALSRRLW